MKKLLVLLPVLGVLAGCAAGINHNIASINGKTYLVETKNKNVFGLAQWSEESTFVDLENKDIGQELAKDYIATVAKKCRSAAKRRANAANNNSGTSVGQKVEVDSKEVYDCIIENLTK